MTEPVTIGRATLPSIYTITNRVNGKRYVGSAVNPKRRWSQHRCDLSAKRHKSPKLQAAWDKYGPEAFDFALVETVGNPSELLVREQFWLDELNTCETGYNCLPVAGSRLGTKHSDETRAKLKEARNRRPPKPCSEETKRKISLAQKGKPRGSPSLEYRQRMSAILKGRKGRRHTPEQRAAISRSLTGKRHSEATRLKMSASQRARFSGDRSDA